MPIRLNFIRMAPKSATPILRTAAARGLLLHARVMCMILICFTACTTRGGAQRTSVQKPSVDARPPEKVRRAILAELQQRGGIETGASGSRITILREASRVIPNLTYYWGVYAPPQTTHVSRVAVVALVNDSVLPLRSPDDWHAAARGSLTLSTDPVVVEACAEAVRMTEASRFPGAPYQIVRTPSEVLQLPIPEPDEVVSKIGPPAVMRMGMQMTAEFWLVQTRDVVRYRCQLAPSRIRVEVLQLIEELGFLPPN